jgi:hypothetical protein
MPLVDEVRQRLQNRGLLALLELLEYGLGCGAVCVLHDLELSLPSFSRFR